MDVGLLVARAARRYAKRVALDGPTGRQTFAEVGARVTQLARGMLGLGLRPGDRVLDLQTNTNTYVETDLALATAGLVRVALNYRLHPSDWLRIAADCDARALIYDTRFADTTVELRDAVDRVVAIGPDSGGDIGLPYEDLLSKQSTEPLLLGLDADSLVSLNYSSGTTGKPKGALRTHRNRLASLMNMTVDVLREPPTETDVYVHAGPITHTSGLFVLPFFTFGAAQLILANWEPEALLDAIEHRGATHTALVPTMIARLLALPECTPERTTGLAMLGYAGAPMPPGQIRQAMERITPNLVQYYGLVEAIPPVTVLDALDHAAGVSGSPELLTSAGRPCLGVEVCVIDETGHRVPAGEVGEVLTRGDHVMRGYWGAEGRHDLSKTVVDGWLHTGDLGKLDADERLYLVDRIGDMIISGGYNIYPREVEDVIAEMPGVHEVAVLGIEDPEWGQRVTALYSVHEGTSVTAEAILEHCRERLASYKKPKEIRLVERFPLSSTGKISKKLLREQLMAEAQENEA
jgi:acyl-CoA synthetase (AMP-forming)/AMP-acid ligase II